MKEKSIPRNVFLAGGALALLILLWLAGAAAPRAPLDGYVLAGNQGYRIGLFGLDGSLLAATRLSTRCEPRGVCWAPDGSLYVAVWSDAPTKNSATRSKNDFLISRSAGRENDRT